MRAPVESKLMIERVGGDATIVDIEGSIGIASVGGSLTLKRVGPSAVEQVAGHLNARSVEGDLTGEAISGNASVRDIEGNMELEKVHGSLALRDAGYKAKASVSGNANLRLDPGPGAQYEIECQGNAYCRLEPPANAEVLLKSESQRILVQTDEGSQVVEAKEHEMKFGKGEASLSVEAGGHVDFRCKEGGEGFGLGIDLDLDLGEDFDDLAEEISDQVGSQMEAQLEALNQQLDALSDQLKVSGSRAVMRAQRQVEATQRRLERKLWARRTKHRPRAFAIGLSPVNEPEPVSDEERMKVLEMVQDKKISIEEAEILLATLEGREPPKKNQEKDEEAQS
jgi:hypothetical protein